MKHIPLNKLNTSQYHIVYFSMVGSRSTGSCLVGASTKKEAKKLVQAQYGNARVLLCHIFPLDEGNAIDAGYDVNDDDEVVIDDVPDKGKVVEICFGT